MKIKPLSETVDKWARRAGAATQDFVRGIDNPRRPWKDATLAAVNAYEQGIAEAIANNMFRKGVDKTTDADWAERARTLGASRYGPGVNASQPRYSRGFAPFHAALEALTLPPRGPRGSEQNYDRVRRIGERLHELRIQGA